MTGTSGPASSFTGVVDSVLAYLGTHTPFPSWVLTRRIDSISVVVAAYDHELDLVPLQVMPADLLSSDDFTQSAMVSAPVLLPDGNMFGWFTGIEPTREVEDPGEIGALLDMLAGPIGALVGAELHAIARSRLAEIASSPVDSLTGLATRQAWEQQIRREEQRSRRLADPLAAILIDLDELKHHNEIHGHESGDAQLRVAAGLVRDAVQGAHLAARLTGDQFGVLMVNCSADEVGTTETAIRRSLSSTGISAVIGVAHHQVGTSLAEVIAEAGETMAASRQAQATLRATLDGASAEAALMQALESGVVRAHFQPIVDLRTGEVVAVEALARWQGEDGMREPDRFMHLLQEGGLLGLLFERILDDGLAHLVEFREVSPALSLAVNFEFDSAPAAGLLWHISERLAAHGLPPSALSLELSERQALDLAPSVQQALTAVAESGVRLILDDFGMGFASMETLTTLPIGGVKLDRAFTSQVSNGDREHAVVKAMISMAAEAGLLVVAEGIETTAQRDQLVRLGCRLGQGYLFSLPRSPEGLVPLLSPPAVSNS